MPGHRLYRPGFAALALILTGTCDTPVQAQAPSVSTSGPCSPVIIDTQRNATSICIFEAPAWLTRYQTLSARFKALEDCSPDAEKARRALAYAQLDEASEAIDRLAASAPRRPSGPADTSNETGPATVLARTVGEVTSIFVGKGQTVRPGQALILLRPTDEQLNLANARTNLARHQALKAGAETELSTLRQRVAAGTAFQEQADQKAKDVDTYGLLVDQDQAAWRRSALALASTVIRVPYCGKVDRVAVAVGDMVSFCSTIVRVTRTACPVS